MPFCIRIMAIIIFWVWITTIMNHIILKGVIANINLFYVTVIINRISLCGILTNFDSFCCDIYKPLYFMYICFGF